jgi:hypothetical protein
MFAGLMRVSDISNRTEASKAVVTVHIARQV